MNSSVMQSAGPHAYLRSTSGSLSSQLSRNSSVRRGSLRRVSAQAQSDKAELLPLTGPEPQRFVVAPGQLLNVRSPPSAPRDALVACARSLGGCARGIRPAPCDDVKVASAAFPFLMRLGCGGFVSGFRSGLPEDDGKYAVLQAGGRKLLETSDTVGTFARPAKPIILYEFEGCPFCRKVREAVCILDLDVMFYPTPARGPTWRPKAKALGGKASFPYMVDENTGVSMYESDDIISYLFEKYGDGKVPLLLRLGPLTTITAGLAMLPRLGKGSGYKGNGKVPEKPLVYWGYEASPFCKVAREALCELELPHLYRAAARGSPKRQILFESRGRFQVPYLEDPNTGVAMFESAAIVEYLYKTYGEQPTATV